VLVFKVAGCGAHDTNGKESSRRRGDLARVFFKYFKALGTVKIKDSPLVDAYRIGMLQCWDFCSANGIDCHYAPLVFNVDWEILLCGR
jgi:hypothetical protein